MKRVTIEDIAERLGLSKFSVSRALSGKPGVSDATRARVVRVAREMGYQLPTRQEPTGAKEGGGNLVLIIRRDEVHDHEFWMDVMSGCEETARKIGYSLVTRPLSLEEMEQPPPLHNVDGLLVAGSRARPAMDRYLTSNIPTVLITYPEPLEDIDSVTIADYEGGFAMAEHLIQLGHRRLVFVSDTPDKPSHSWRNAGFRARVEMEQGAEIIQLAIAPDAPGASFEKAFFNRSPVDDLPTAIFCATDGLALTVMWALNRNGVSVPDDVSVVGCNDILEAQRATPELTTLQIPKREIGTEAVLSLIQRINGERIGKPPRRLVLMPRLVVRSSTAAPSGKVRQLQPS